MGVVYEAFDTGIERPVALKMLRTRRSICGTSGLSPLSPTLLASAVGIRTDGELRALGSVQRS